LDNTSNNAHEEAAATEEDFNFDENTFLDNID